MNGSSREELLELLRQCSPRSRKTLIRSVEGRASEDGVAFVKEILDFVEPDNTVRSVEHVSARTCDSGHVLDANTRLMTVASCCGALTCSTEGCSLTCVRCGGSLCRRHATVYRDGEVYCGRCRPFRWLRTFFDVGGRGRKQ